MHNLNLKNIHDEIRILDKIYTGIVGALPFSNAVRKLKGPNEQTIVESSQKHRTCNRRRSE